MTNTTDSYQNLFDGEGARAFPPYLMYDVINVCNARCVHCPQSSIADRPDFKPKRLSWAVFEKTITEAAKYKSVEIVRFTGDGEPLMHPDIFRMVARARELGLPKVNLTTNGSLLSGKKLESLLKANPHVVDMSLDALYPETFARVRVGLDFEVVKANLMELLKLRPKEMKVIVSLVRQPGMEQEALEFEQFWKDKVNFVAIRGLHSNLGLSAAPGVSRELARWPCPHLWQRLVVDYRGHIRYCPVDWEDRTSMGSAEELSLFEVWQGEKLNELRANHVCGSYSKCGACENCGDWAQTQWNRNWLQMMRKEPLQVSKDTR